VIATAPGIKYLALFFYQKWFRQGEEIVKSKWGDPDTSKGGDAYRKWTIGKDLWALGKDRLI